jgi:beta-phosphoglucomutase-like phosphatase (HAD superfamily)
MLDTRFGGVLFDMDGTLVDSEKVWSVGLDEWTVERVSGEGT